ncbi:MAG: glycosyltransferase family 4 protein [Myxococcales bacterium]|nr:glycosyltransferase family 4 protein [Myxococcales bacterium]
MHVLVLHQHYVPETAATAQLLGDLCEDLAANGLEVTVITAQPSYRNPIQVERLPAREVRAGVRIHRVRTYIPQRRTIPRRLFHYGSYFASGLIESLRGDMPDVALILSTPPLLLGLTASVLKALKGVPFVYSVQDLYPDIAQHLGILRSTLFYRFIDHVASKLYRNANQIVTLSNTMRQSLLDKGVEAERCTVIPNWADTDAIRPLPRNNGFAKTLGLDNRFVVMYAGNVGLTQGLDVLVEAAHIVRDLPITFAIIGDGNGLQSLKHAVNDRGLCSFVFFPPQPRTRLGELLASSDAGFVSMQKGIAHDLVPSKLYGIMAASRPVIASVEADSEVARVIRKHGCGLVAPAQNPHRLAEALKTAYGDSGLLMRQGCEGRRAAEFYYSRQVCTARYASILEQFSPRS